MVKVSFRPLAVFCHATEMILSPIGQDKYHVTDLNSVTHGYKSADKGQLFRERHFFHTSLFEHSILALCVARDWVLLPKRSQNKAEK